MTSLPKPECLAYRADSDAMGSKWRVGVASGTMRLGGVCGGQGAATQRVHADRDGLQMAWPHTSTMGARSAGAGQVGVMTEMVNRQPRRDGAAMGLLPTPAVDRHRSPVLTTPHTAVPTRNDGARPEPAVPALVDLLPEANSQGSTLGSHRIHCTSQHSGSAGGAVLRAIEGAFGLSFLGGASSAPDLSHYFG